MLPMKPAEVYYLYQTSHGTAIGTPFTVIYLCFYLECFLALMIGYSSHYYSLRVTLTALLHLILICNSTTNSSCEARIGFGGYKV